MTDWKQHDGGPQPVADDVLVTTWSPDEGGWRIPASAVDWSSRGFQWRVINQRLIDAARLEGIEMGLEAAVKACQEQAESFLLPSYAVDQPLSSFQERFACGQCAEGIRALNPETIAREAVLDQLTREAQAHGMGYAEEAGQ